MNSVIVVAAGNSSRMKNKMSKQLLEIGGVPVIVRTLLTFCSLNEIDSVTIVTRKSEFEVFREYIKKYNITKVRSVIEGGDTRQKSVLCGLKSLCCSDDDNVLIHDGARPFIKKEVILKIIAALNSGSVTAAAVGVPVKDTIKQLSRDGYVAGTPDRSTLYSIQTPQAFKYKLILNAHIEAAKNGISVTDDCAVLEAVCNEKILIIKGDYDNIKITTPEDIILGESIANGLK